MGVTHEHPFWVVGEGWTPASELKEGDALFTSHGGWVRVSGSTWEQARQTVYNMEVEGFHTFFVGAERVLVHNTCSFQEMSQAPDWKSKPNWGHTFSRHGAGKKVAKKLTGRAGGKGQPQGQWTNNETASEFLFNIARAENIQTPTMVQLPEGLGQVIMPDGTTQAATHAMVIPNMKTGTVRTAFPIIP